MESHLGEHERTLFGRQMRIPGVGEVGQLKIKSARILVVGAGGLGSPAAMYLAAAGVMTLGVADPDEVELSNLHRQILHGFDTLGLPKTISAAEALSEINPGIRIALHPEGVKPETISELLSRYDLVLDGTDNFATRYLIADACVLAQKPLVHGSVLRHEGQVGVFLPKCGCYRCVYPMMPDPASVPTCAESGVLGATCGVIGSWMASEALAIVLGQRTQSRLQIVDVAGGTAKVLQIKPDLHCPLCGSSPTIQSIRSELYQPTICPAPMMNDVPLEVSVEEARDLLHSDTPPLLIDVREPDEHAHCRISYAKLIPMASIPERLSEIPQNRALLVHCHHGGRSLRVTQFLRSKGYKMATNVKGGIDAWSLKIDPQVPRY